MFILDIVVIYNWGLVGICRRSLGDKCLDRGVYKVLEGMGGRFSVLEGVGKIL